MVAATLAAGAPAFGLDCPQTPLVQRIDEADAAFVGRLISQRPAPGGHGQRLYRFEVAQQVKGPVGGQVEVRAGRLTDTEGTPLADDVAVGVLASLDGATFVTSSCGLVDPGGLLAETNKPRGNAIKIVIGVVLLLAVIGFSIVRLRRRGQGASSTLAP